MLKKLKSWFLSDSLFKNLPWVCTAAAFVYASWVFFWPTFTQTYLKNAIWNGVLIISIVICLFIIVKSYYDHNKNLMKGLDGFVFAAILVKSIYELFLMTNGSLSFSFKVALTVLTAVIVLNHFIMANDHKSQSNAIYLNYCAMIAYLCLSAIGIVVNVITSDSKLAEAGELLVMAFISIPVMLTVLCIETRVNEFKIIREEKAQMESEEGK